MKHITSTMRGRVAVLIATCDRPYLLARRALPSVFSQEYTPDRVILVDDSKSERNSKLVYRYIRRFYPKVETLRNRRTEGISGALNSGIDHLARTEKDAAAVFVAILDDDDRWRENHLRECIGSAKAGSSNMVASGLIRITEDSTTEHKHSIPDNLDPEKLFTKGQHIQGSNLFLSLDLLLKAGMFDEHLSSCTDRDLCLRLSRLPDLRFSNTTQHTVEHYADMRSDRLSAPGSHRKCQGLTCFWRKHASSFTANLRKQAYERAKDLFGWRLPNPGIPTVEIIPDRAFSNEKLSFIVGLITDAYPKGHVDGLLQDLLRLSSDPQVDSLKVIVLENGPREKGSFSPLKELVSKYRSNGLEVELVSLEQQASDWKSGIIPDCTNPFGSRRPIAVTRTILNTYLVRASDENSESAIWILDDDKRLKVRVRGNDTDTYVQSPNIGGLIELKRKGVDIVIGPDTDAAPLPFIATTRLQLLDLENFIASIATDPDVDELDFDCGAGLGPILKENHYDLSRVTEHLEAPQPINLDATDKKVRSILRVIVDRIDRILAGEPLFRHLKVDQSDFGTDRLSPSVQRGGSTIFFSAKALGVYPQTVSRVGNQFLRRSDMITALFMRELMGMHIVMHAFAGVSHDRAHTAPQGLLDETLQQDVIGYALYRAVEDVLEARKGKHEAQHLLAFTEEELKSGEYLVRKYVEERLAAFRLNIYRVKGLCDTICKHIERLLHSESTCQDETLRGDLLMLHGKITSIGDEFDTTRANQFITDIQSSLTGHFPIDTLRSIDGIIHEYQLVTGVAQPESPHIVEERDTYARKLIQKSFGLREITLLGHGGEGMVYTNGKCVYKVFDLLKHRPGHDTFRVIQDFKTRMDEPKFTYPIQDIHTVDGTIIVSYPFEESTIYRGGYGQDLIGMLHEFKDAGFVFRNMHPDNIRVTESGLKLIDIGSDIRPYSEAGYRSMAERAWLTWRWPHRQDLRLLMRAVLRDKSIPELQGFERFWKALNSTNPSATYAVDWLVSKILKQHKIDSVLDYGCGKKAWTIRSLAPHGIRCVGYDPDRNLIKRWEASDPVDAVLTTDRDLAIAGSPFDAVVSSLVLCEIPDGEKYEQVLSDLSASMKDDGLAIITICNPFSTFGQPTPLHKARVIPQGKEYSECFWFKEFAESGKARDEFHRPLYRIERDLMRHGLTVQERIESETIDTNRFEPASDFMTLLCRKTKALSATPSVSLVIKTCGMEASTIERQVRHLVGQLEGPHVFSERVLLLDSLSDCYIRQYATSDVNELKAAAQRLISHGIVDRIIEAPFEEGPVSRIIQDWFDLACSATHSLHGAPLAGPLHAFEACTGEYILQVDSDLLVHRSAQRQDYLMEMISAIQGDPKAITASLSIAQKETSPYSAGDEEKPWRVEVRGCLLHRERFLRARPYPNHIEKDHLSLSWHRSVDERVKSGNVHSLRGKSDHTWFIHPENELKHCTKEWMLMLDLVEKGFISSTQYGNVNLLGRPASWLPRNRLENYVFILTGRNVPPERMARCLDSILVQKRKDWGAIIIDDGSEPRIADSLRQLVAPHSDKITLLQPRERRGQLSNMILAIRNVCSNHDSTIITLDLDDCLLGDEVLNRLAKEYDAGADLTVGSMRRTDKQSDYPVNFQNPRAARGGNIWQHLRSFKKSLFEQVPDHYLRVDNDYVDIAVDWSFMLPMVEMAKKPVWIQDPLYLYEPSGMGKGADKSKREHQIAKVIAKPSAAVLKSKAKGALLQANEISGVFQKNEPGILFIRHAERPSLRGLPEEEKHLTELTESGINQSKALGASLQGDFRLASSPITRATQTAEAIAAGARLNTGSIFQTDVLKLFIRGDKELYTVTKKRLGWNELMLAWIEGSLRPGLLYPSHDVSIQGLKSMYKLMETPNERILAVTHDFFIIALLASLKGFHTTKIPYLSGVFVSYAEMEHWLQKEVPNER